MSKREDVIFKVSAEEAKAIDAFRRLVSSQEKVEKGAKKTGKAMKEQSKSTRESADGFLKLAAATTGLNQGLGVVSKLGVSLEAVSEQLNEIGRKANSAAPALTSFWSVMPGGETANIQAKKMLLSGVEAGLTPAQSAEIYEPLVSSLNVGDKQIDRKELSEILNRGDYAEMASFIGMQPGKAAQAEITGANRGLEAGKALGQMLQMSTAAGNFYKTDIAPLMPAMLNYSDYAAGGAAAVAVGAGGYDAQAAKEPIRGAARILGAEGDVKDFVKKRNLVGADELEKVRYLRREAEKKGDQSLPVQERVMRYTSKYAGMGIEETSARGLKAIVDNYKVFLEKHKEIAAANGQTVVDMYQSTLARPGQRNMLDERITNALKEYNFQLGELGEAAQGEHAKRLQEGTKLMNMGLTFGYDLETGESTKWGHRGMMVANMLNPALYASSPQSPATGMYLQSEKKDPHTQHQQANAEMLSTLQKQNEILEAQLVESRKANERADAASNQAPIYSTESNN